MRISNLVLRTVQATMVTVAFAACHHSETKPERTAAVTSTYSQPTEKYTGPSEERIANDYSLLQLDSASGAMKVAAELASSTGADPVNLFGCPISAKLAEKSSKPLKDLLETRIIRERSSYTRSPAAFLKSRGAQNCELNCSCAVLTDVLSTVDTRQLKATEKNPHEASLADLQNRASQQNSEQAEKCAKKQTWICGSNLLTYLTHISTTAP